MEEAADDGEADVVDGRVEGALEGLNAAIEDLNELERTREACEAAASRSAALIEEELRALDADAGDLERAIQPFLSARAAASSAIDRARAAEATCLCVCAAETQANAAWAEAEASGTREGLLAAKQELRSARKSAKEARAESRRLERIAELRAERLREEGVALERANGTTVGELLRLHEDYTERRAGLVRVVTHSEARLAELAEAKEAATEHVTEAMDGLEALSNALHEAAADGGGEGGGGDADGGNGAGGARESERSCGKAGEGACSWMEEASYRASGWSEGSSGTSSSRSSSRSEPASPS